MDIEIDDSAEEEKARRIVVLLVGPPGSGKSTFCDCVMRSSCRPWARVCQDTINNGKAGTKPQCLKMAADALEEGKSVFIDRCNLAREQRLEFVRLGGPEVEVHAVVLDLPAQVCISRSVKRTGHEGNLQGGKAAAVVNRMLQKKELPKLSEGFSRIMFCINDNDIQTAVTMYSGLGLKDTLSQGCFGQKNLDAKVQLGITKFLKKVDAPSGSSANETYTSHQAKGKMAKKEEAAYHVNSIQLNSADDIPTLVFPSISTADFQFDLDKASDIIVETVEEFIAKLGHARLVLVDLSYGSKILSLVKTKASQKNIDSARFFTFVGDITKLHSEGALRCSVIANAANWRLKQGGGGVNAAIFKAAGPDFEAATKEQAKSLLPGKAVAVPLPLTSPLRIREGITHVIHVLGPNMNPNRPNYLNNDYTKGCKILREAYTSLFQGFLSIIRSQSKLPKRSNESIASGSLVSCSDDMTSQDSERNKKSRGLQDEDGADVIGSRAVKDERSSGTSNNKGWDSWALALYNVAIHPERHEAGVLEVSDDIVVISDRYPKARKHLLVLARQEGLDWLADVRREHLQLLQKMHDVGLKWVKRFLDGDSSMIFRLGYHSIPSMRQLHLHVISQDFDSDHLKNKKHWNSFNSGFFRDSVDVIDEINGQGSVTVKGEDMLKMELRCHRCKSAHPNVPKLKSHISHCRASFPHHLLHKDRLLFGPSNSETQQ